jgi:YVTN family beta-propeller protein
VAKAEGSERERPDGKTLYVVGGGANTLIPINAATNKPCRPIKAGRTPVAIAITP